MTMPSREFLVRQAVLNATHRDFPLSVRRDGVAGVLKYITESKEISPFDYGHWFVSSIRDEFLKLAARHETWSAQ